MARRGSGRRTTTRSRVRAGSKRRLPASVVETINERNHLGIRAGVKPHRIIGIWAVVVDDRVFVRSWSLKPRSWWRTFQEDPRGIIQVGTRKVRIRAVVTRSEPMRTAVSKAYMKKYGTPTSVKYARDLGQPKSRKTTTELVPR